MARSKAEQELHEAYVAYWEAHVWGDRTYWHSSCGEYHGEFCPYCEYCGRKLRDSDLRCSELECRVRESEQKDHCGP